MPVLTSSSVVGKFKERCLMFYPDEQVAGSDSMPLDDSLTSLHWLQNFSILSADPEPPNGAGPGCPSAQQHLHLRRLGFPGGGADSPSSPPAGDTAATGMPLHLGSPVTSGSASNVAPRFSNCAHVGGYAQIPIQASPPVEIDYKSNPKVKPPYSYASLICMAMQASKQPKVTLSTIYNWITENFCYYRHAEPSWQNSIRHNLSLNKCFKKVPRQKDEPGKGGFWQIDPQYADMFVNGIFKRRRMSASSYNSNNGGSHRQSKLIQGCHGAQNGCLYQSGNGTGGKRKHVAGKSNGKATRMTQSPLLATEANKADILRGDFDLASVFDDVLSGNCSTFEDLDINTALSSLGCELEVSMQGRQHSTGPGRWCGGGDVGGQNQHPNHHQSYSYADAGAPPMECALSVGELQALQHHHPQQMEPDQLLQNHHHLQHFEEAATLFQEQPDQAVLQPWEEIKEEAHSIPLTLDQGFGLCEGFFMEMQPWDRVEAYL